MTLKLRSTYRAASTPEVEVLPCQPISDSPGVPQTKSSKSPSNGGNAHAPSSRTALVVLAACAIVLALLVISGVVLILADNSDGAQIESAPEANPRPIELVDAPLQPALADPEVSAKEEPVQMAEAAKCPHQWEKVYKLIPGEVDTAEREQEYETDVSNHTVCNVCQTVVDGVTAEHEAETGHDAFTPDVPITSWVPKEDSSEEGAVGSEEELVPAFAGELCELCGDFKAADQGDQVE